MVSAHDTCRVAACKHAVWLDCAPGTIESTGGADRRSPAIRHTPEPFLLATEGLPCRKRLTSSATSRPRRRSRRRHRYVGRAHGSLRLAAGLSGAVDSSTIVVTAGLAEIAAGSIAMGLGGYLAARSDAEHYESEQRREWQEVREKPELEAQEVRMSSVRTD